MKQRNEQDPSQDECSHSALRDVARQDVANASRARRWLLSGPVKVGAFFAILAIVLTLVGLWREHNLSLRNILLGIVLCGGTWGLISWAIATAAAQVEEDVASKESKDS